MTAGVAPAERAFATSEARKKPHLDPLTSIRFFAAFHVVIYHNAGYLVSGLPAGFLPELMRNAASMGYGGVNLFFVLSGFILAYTYLEPDRLPALDRRRFWVARLARIYPVYLLSLGLVAPLVFAHFFSNNVPLVALAKAGVSGLSAVTLTHAWFPPFRAIWNSPGWSLSAEAFFYLLFPLLAVWIWRLSRIGSLLIAGLSWLACAVPFALGLLLLPEDVAWRAATDSTPAGHLAAFLRIAPIFRVSEFILGIALARAFFPQRPADPGQRPRWAAPLALAAMLAIGVAYLLGDHIPRQLVHAGVLNPIYAALIVGLAHCGSRSRLHRLLSARWLLLLGEASYSIYVLHIPIRGWLLLAIGETRADELGLTFFALYAGIVIAASIAAFWWLEDPARRWIRSRFSAPRSSSSRQEPA